MQITILPPKNAPKRKFRREKKKQFVNKVIIRKPGWPLQIVKVGEEIRLEDFNNGRS